MRARPWAPRHCRVRHRLSSEPTPPPIIDQGADMATTTADNIQIIGGVDTHQVCTSVPPCEPRRNECYVFPNDSSGYRCESSQWRLRVRLECECGHPEPASTPAGHSRNGKCSKVGRCGQGRALDAISAAEAASRHDAQVAQPLRQRGSPAGAAKHQGKARDLDGMDQVAGRGSVGRPESTMSVRLMQPSHRQPMASWSDRACCGLELARSIRDRPVRRSAIGPGRSRLDQRATSW